MRLTFAVIAVLALVGIGTVEAVASSAQLAELPGRARPALSAGGTALTIVSAVLSLAIYAGFGLILAWTRTAESRALVMGMGVGFAAGLVGGAVRAYLVGAYVSAVLAGYGLADLAVFALGIFVALAVALSVSAGAVTTWLSYRAGRRLTSPRPQR